MSKKNIDKVMSAAKDRLYFWKPNAKQKKSNDQGWIHMSDLRELLKKI